MQTLEGVKLIKEIETDFDVMSIKYKGISVWPFLRFYIKDSITTQSENKPSASVVGLVIRCLFSYNPFGVFKRHDVWNFSACERRKKIGDKMVHRISGAFASNKVNSLMIEKPLNGVGHYSRKKIEEREIVSEAWLLMTFHLIVFLSKFKTLKIENEQLLRQILSEKDIKFNYSRYVRVLNAQRMAMRILLKIVPNPKIVTMECPYNTMGYMWAFHQAGIKVIELQHGSLNGNHIAYNAKEYEPRMNPDCICVFGEEEYKYFTAVEPQFSPEVKMTGLYMLERANQFFSKDVFSEDRMVYRAIIVVAGQPVYEEILSRFIDSLAEEHRDLLFVYIPRHHREDIHFNSDNIRLVNGVNIYEYLKWADLHITVSSSTGLEAQYFRTPTIFYNYNNISARYFRGILEEKNGVSFVDTPQGFTEAIHEMYGRSFSYREIFAHDHVKRIMDVVNENLNN